MIRVLLIDDELRLCRAWEKLFRARSDMEVVGTLTRADELAAAVATSSPDVVVIDLTMPGLDPITAIRELASLHPSVKAIVYSGHSDPRALREAYDAGAWGYIDKLASTAHMFDAIRRVAAGEIVFPAAVADGDLVRGE